MRTHVKIGDVYDNWTVIEAPHYDRGRNINTLRAVCECKCGTVRELSLRNVLRGKSKSCGCIPNEETRERMTIHGEASPLRLTPEYVVWKGIMQRCGKHANETEAQNYRDRGIYVCDRWKTFKNFLADMGRRPSPEHQIDRIDNDGGYVPGNTRWVTRTEQLRNTRRNVRITYNGKTLCLTEWS